ncbi:hypothetical protein AKO1_001436 [Acrasis kona]|uniref:DUF427 domain-containing protein n=1 Tax=Acrasis kona TaxID=1008807 RepID=A0AAW2YVK4_9EUKA
MNNTVKRDPVGEGQESCWSYPRPPLLEKVNKQVKIVFNGVTIADTKNAYCVKETSHPPVYYISPSDLKMEHIKRDTSKSSFCEWKGRCSYWNVEVAGKRADGIGFSYDDPTKNFEPIKGYLSFYAGPMDGCYVDGEKVTPQPGNFYSGWITKNVVGPFKGSPGTMFW